MPIDWKHVQNSLFNLASEAVRRFVPEHPDERFYGFAFDVDPVHGGVLLCLNSEKEFARTKLQYAGEPAERLEIIRWSTGDWRYQGFEDDAFKAGWNPFRDEIETEYHEQFSQVPCSAFEMMLGSACLVVLRMERAGVFSGLNRTPEFKSFVCGSDEDVENGWARFRSIREADSDPLPYEEAARYAELYHHANSLQEPITRDRRSVPESLWRKFLQEAHSLPFQPCDEGEWIIYSSEAESALWSGGKRFVSQKPFEVRYREYDRSYHLNVGEAATVPCFSVFELVSQLERCLPIKPLESR